MKRVGLFFGINKYKNGISQIQCAVNDAKYLSYAFAREGYDVDFFQDEACTSEKIAERVAASLEGLSAGDIFVFYFAGHGREFNGAHYLVGSGGYEKDSLYSLGSLHFDTLLELTNSVPGLIRLFILDCCRNNILSARDGRFVCDKSRDIALNKALTAHYNKVPAAFPALVLNACDTGERAYENPDTGHGYFSEALIRTIEKKSISSFQAFHNNLILSATPGPQNITWKGNLTKWNQVCLFEHWKNAVKDFKIHGKEFNCSRLRLQWNDYSFLLLGMKTMKLGRNRNMANLVIRTPDRELNLTVSKHHATISADKNAAYIANASNFGTWFNGKKLEGNEKEKVTEEDSVVQFGDVCWYMHLQLCEPTCKDVCQTCNKERVKSLTFDRCDGIKEKYLMICQCCDLGRVMPELKNWDIFYRNGSFFIKDPLGECYHLLPDTPVESSGQKFIVSTFEG